MTDYADAVSALYGRGDLTARVFEALEKAGVDADNLTVDTLSPIDELHIAGREHTLRLARMAGPLPAENTPLFPGGDPNHSFKMERRVAKPIPAGKPRSQKRNRRDNSLANRSASPAEAMSACATMQVCSVSSETIPFEKRKW